MKKNLLVSAFAWIGALYGFSSVALGASGDGLRLLSFNVSQVSIFQKGGGDVFTGEIGWSPGYYTDSGIGARAELGATLLKDSAGGKNPAFRANLLINHHLTPSIYGEVGGGIEYWSSNGGVLPNATLVAGFELNTLLHSIYLEYSPIFISNNLSHEIQVGTQIWF